MAIRKISLTVGEINRRAFDEALECLASRQGGGMETYQARGSSILHYDPLARSFYHSRDLGGYRPGSLSGRTDATSEEVNDLYAEVELGLAELWILPCMALIQVGFEPQRIYKGSYNMEVVK